MNKVTVIGTGSVGSTIAYTLTYGGIASEIVMIDINGKKAMGEALDIRQGTAFCSPCYVYAGTYRDAADSNIVIITSGLARKPGQSRLDLAQVNVDMMKKIIPEITRYAPDATYIIVSNPVDILTYVFCRLSGIPESRIIGSGTILDTARLRSRLSDYYGVNQKNVHAYVLGEHGDSSFIPWSLANLSNIPVLNYSRSVTGGNQIHPRLDTAEVEDFVRKSGARVIERKGATFYAVSMAVCHLCQCLAGSMDTALTVSTMLHGEYGIDDVCISILCNVSKEAVQSKLLLPLNEEETALLRKSAENLKAIIRETKI